MIGGEKVDLRGVHGCADEVDVCQHRAAVPIRLQCCPGCRIEQIDNGLGIVLDAIHLDGGGDFAELQMRALSKIINHLLAATIIGCEIVLAVDIGKVIGASEQLELQIIIRQDKNVTMKWTPNLGPPAKL
jgi:hypothetical protein